jgi:hypothetical protein
MPEKLHILDCSRCEKRYFWFQGGFQRRAGREEGILGGIDPYRK